MSKAFDNLIKKVKDKVPNMIGDGSKRSIMWADVPSPQIAYMLGGNIPIGRIIRFRGPYSAGKTSVCNYIAGCLQREVPKLTGNPDQNKIVYVDFERSYESKFAASVGVLTDSEHFVHLKPESIEDASEVLDELVKTCELAGIIWDSDGASPTRASMTNEAGKATFGGSARATAEFLMKFNILCADRNTTILWISQERANMNPMAHLPKPTGGEAIPFYASIICRITKSDDIKGPDGEIIGIEIKIKNMKNKCANPFRLAEGVKLMYHGGFNSDEEYVDFFLKLGFVTQKGAYFQFDYNDEHFSLQGRKKLMDWLYSHDDVYTEWKKAVKEKLASFTEELDADNFAVDEESGEALNEKDAEKAKKYAIQTSSTQKVTDEEAEEIMKKDA